MILSKDTTKNVNIDQLIAGKLHNDLSDEILFVVPTNRKVRRMTIDLLSRRHGTMHKGLNIETLESFCDRLLRGQAAYKSLNESSASVILRQCINHLKPRFFLEYRAGIPSGTIKKLYDTFTEYKRQGIASADLKERMQNLNAAEAAKAADIFAVYNEYINRCNQLKFFQAGEKYRAVNGMDTRKFSDQFRLIFNKADLIIIYGFDQFSAPEIDLINKMSALNDISMYILLDYYEHNPAIFEHLRPVSISLQNSGFRIIREIHTRRDRKFRTDIKKRLFNTSLAGKISEYSGHISVIESLTTEGGIEVIAREIKRLILEESVPADNICVAFNLVEKFTPCVRDIFRVYGIPSNITDRQKLENSQVVSSLINFMEIKENDFYYKNIIRALSQGLITVGNFDHSSYIRIISGLKITAGYNLITASIKEIIESNSAACGETISSAEKDVLWKEQTALDGILSALNQISGLLSEFTQFMTPDGFLGAMKNLIIKLGLPRKLLENKSPSETIEESIQALSLLLETAEDIASIAKSETEKSKHTISAKTRTREAAEYARKTGEHSLNDHPLKYYMDKLREAAANARFGVREKPGYGVLVTALEEIRGLEFDYLFIAGINDGVLPTRYSPQIFVQDSFQRNELQHQAYERYRFYQSLCAWKKGLYLSTALYDSGNELPVSGFLEDFVSLFEVTRMNESSLKNYIYSEEDYQRHYLSVGAAEQPELSYTPRAQKKLGEMRFYTYSVTQLEQYAACPFEYMVSRLFQAEILKEPDEEAGRFEIGALIHTILFEFFTTLRKLKISLPGAGRTVRKRAEGILFDIAERHISRISVVSAMSFFEFEKITGIRGKRSNSILYRFLLNEQKGSRLFLPEYFEASFGNPDDEPSDELLSDNTPVSMGDVNIRGKIDRIEVDEQQRRFMVVDYKTGTRRPQLNDIQRGLSLQLPVYLYAAEVLLNRKTREEYYPAGALIYSLRFNGRDFGRFSLSDKRSSKPAGEAEVSFWREMTAQAESYINYYVEQISIGSFRLSVLKDREETVCRNCSYRRICRIQEK